MRYYATIVFTFSILFAHLTCAQPSNSHKKLSKTYPNFKEKSIQNRRFKHAHIVPLIKKLKRPFEVEQIGKSIEGRAIYSVKIGRGATKVLLWSQMHGNEPTATMAIMDIFNFLGQSGDKFDDFRANLFNQLTLYFVPMLNPDGAEKYRRRNALDVDLNRDALRLQSPEAKILKNIRDEIKADWGFNLHDQNIYYGAGMNPFPAAISFLAPAYNYEKDINEVRDKSMRLIGYMNQVLQEYIPEKVAKYNDDFEPRAFGDNIQRWGTSTILIESGGLTGDTEKQALRKMNYLILLSAFEAIANRTYTKVDLSEYEQIPFNESNLFQDLLLREVKVVKGGKIYTLDISFRQGEVQYNDYQEFYPRAYIRDIGDLSIFHAYKELAPQGFIAEPGKVYYKTVRSASRLKSLDPIELLKKGITNIPLMIMPSEALIAHSPIQLFSAKEQVDNSIRLGNNPCLLLKKNGKVQKVVINGMLYDLVEDEEKIRIAWTEVLK